ncbi:MAG: SPOR domain-containing protein [Gammaproteobacteria bacterium]|nr:SPOR domain-containing protein [Gammaproteobacteria bacterium]
MRRLLLVLLLANLAMLAWRYWVLVPEPGEPPPSGQDSVLALVDEPRLDARPMDEVPVADVPVVADEPTVDEVDVEPPLSTVPPPARETVVPVAAVRCVSIGPFASPEVSARFAEELRGKGLSPVQQAEEGELWAGYWLVAPFDSRDEARAAAAQLREGGVPDAYVIPGEEIFTVSLGLFTQRQRAERLRDQAEAFGVQAELRDRYRSATVYRLQLEVPEGVELPPLPEGAAARDARIQPVSCPPR